MDEYEIAKKEFEEELQRSTVDQIKEVLRAKRDITTRLRAWLSLQKRAWKVLVKGEL